MLFSPNPSSPLPRLRQCRHHLPSCLLGLGLLLDPSPPSHIRLHVSSGHFLVCPFFTLPSRAPSPHAGLPVSCPASPRPGPICEVVRAVLFKHKPSHVAPCLRVLRGPITHVGSHRRSGTSPSSRNVLLLPLSPWQSCCSSVTAYSPSGPWSCLFLSLASTAFTPHLIRLSCTLW